MCREAQILYIDSFTGTRNLGLDEQIQVWIVEWWLLGFGTGVERGVTAVGAGCLWEVLVGLDLCGLIGVLDTTELCA